MQTRIMSNYNKDNINDIKFHIIITLKPEFFMHNITLCVSYYLRYISRKQKINFRKISFVRL
jgi:hypothetical protein